MAPGIRSVLLGAACVLGCACHEHASAQSTDDLGDDIAPPTAAGAEAEAAVDEPAVAEHEAEPVDGSHRSNAGGAQGIAARAAARAEETERLALLAFTRAEAARVAFESLHFDLPTLGSPQLLVDAMVARMRSAFSQAGSISADYTLATQGTDLDRTIAAWVGSAQVWETLARALLHFSAPPAPSFPPGITPIDGAPRPWAPAGGLDASALPLPRDRTADVSDVVQIADAFTRAFDPWTRAVECVAVGRYALAARAAHVSVARSPAIEIAWARLASYSEARIAECIAVVRTGDTEHGITGDPTFARYAPGEFYRAPLGATADLITIGVSLDTLE